MQTRNKKFVGSKLLINPFLDEWHKSLALFDEGNVAHYLNGISLSF